MAVELLGNEYTVTGTAVPLTTALGLSNDKFFTALTVRAGRANVGTIYLGRSSLTSGANRFIYLDARESFTIDINVGYCGTGQWFIVGSSPGDIAHFAGVS